MGDSGEIEGSIDTLVDRCFIVGYSGAIEGSTDTLIDRFFSELDSGAIDGSTETFHRFFSVGDGVAILGSI